MSESIFYTYGRILKSLSKKPELDSVLFNKVVIKFHKLCKIKSNIAFILKRTSFSSKMIKVLKNWVDKETRSESEYIHNIINDM